MDSGEFKIDLTDFGELGKGDDTAIFNKVIEFADLTDKYVEVFVPKGEYRLGQVTEPKRDNVYFVGSNCESTIIIPDGWYGVFVSREIEQRPLAVFTNVKMTGFRFTSETLTDNTVRFAYGM